MRLGEECPYITPCGWCSRKEKPCEKENKNKKSVSVKSNSNNKKDEDVAPWE